MKPFSCILFLVLTFGLNAQSPFMGDLSAGPYTVGFKTISVTDNTRTYNGQPRPLLICLWYPSATSSEDRVLFEDYLFVDAAKTSLITLGDSEKTETRGEFLEKIKARGADEKALKELLNLPTYALHQSKGINQAFPLVLALQGGGRPASTHFILNEYLASHGYLVVSFSDIYASPNRRQNTAVQNIEALGLDIQLAISTIKSQPELSISEVGALGFSRAGEAILFHHINEGNLEAIITMDGQPGPPLVEALGTDRLAQLEAPLLAFFSNHQKRMTLEQAQADSLAFEFLPNAPRVKIRMMELNHGDQTSSGMIAGNLVKNYNRWPLIGDAKMGYETVCELTKAFFDAYLKDIEAAKQLLAAPYLQLGLQETFLVIHQIKNP